MTIGALKSVADAHVGPALSVSFSERESGKAHQSLAATQKAQAHEVDAAFASGRTRPLAWRRKQLQGLDSMLTEHEEAFLGALRADLHKGRFEAVTTELAYVRTEIKHAQSNLAAWTAPQRVSTPFVLQPGRSHIRREPLGVVLVIGAWNMPVPVLLGPVVAALAAGNAVVMKPSELAPATGSLIARLVPKYLDGQAVRVVEGGIAETTELLDRPWGHIFYTGNGNVGRVVALAAARHLTPVTLELGGKSPAYVHHDADLKVSALRLAWAKWMNAGQVCVAPDFLFVERSVAEALAAALRDAITGFFGQHPEASADYGRIINTRHHDRLTALLADHGGQVMHGGAHHRQSLYIEPTIVMSPHPDSPLMADEIFGPILPIVPVEGVDEAIARINAGPKPLTLHAFTRSKTVAQRMEMETSSGALLINDAIVNHRVHGLPFGGVGASGYGAYHGRAGFETFSHRKAVMRRPTMLDNALRYPPYTARGLALIRRLMGV